MPGLSMFVFNVHQVPEELTESHCKGLDILQQHGIPVVFHRKCNTAEEIIRMIDEIGDMRGELDYDIDGAVIKINRYSDRELLGNTSKIPQSMDQKCGVVVLIGWAQELIALLYGAIIAEL